MARSIPDDRLERLVECATKVFIAQGYQRTQMADVATALGVAKGTLYLYVESKDALFDLVARCAAGDRRLLEAKRLPLPTPKAGATLRYAREQLGKRQNLPKLAAALERARVSDARSELEAIARELYETLHANRTGIKLLDRSAPEHPELAAIWFKQGREGLLALLTAYIESRIARGTFRSVPDVAVAARLILETTVFWAVHRHWDPHPQQIDESAAEATVVDLVVRLLLKE